MKPAVCARILGVAFVFGSCDGSEGHPAGEMFGEGSRLRAIWEQAPGAPKVLRGWYDTQLGTTCTFPSGGIRAPTVQDVSYCLPTPHASGAITTFADPACTVPVVPGSAARWFLPIDGGPDGDFCSARGASVVEIGEAVGPTTLFSTTSGSCQPWSPPDTASEFRHLGRSIPLEGLVSAGAARARGEGARVTPLVREASDGSWAYTGAGWDEQLATIVRMQGVASPRWYPDTGAAIGIVEPAYFSDSACGTRAAAIWGCPKANRYTLGAETVRRCQDPAPTYFRSGQQLDPTRVFQLQPSGACEPISGTGNVSFFSVAEVLSADDLAPTSVTEVGSGRLKLRLIGSDGGPPVTTEFYRDSEKDLRCVASTASDGAIRCLPFSALDLPYGDPSCTQRLVGLSDCEDHPSLIAFYDSKLGAARVFAREQATVTSLFQRDSNGGCVPWAGLEGQVYYPLGAEVPPNEFVEMSRSPVD